MELRKSFKMMISCGDSLMLPIFTSRETSMRPDIPRNARVSKILEGHRRWRTIMIRRGPSFSVQAALMVSASTVVISLIETQTSFRCRFRRVRIRQTFKVLFVLANKNKSVGSWTKCFTPKRFLQKPILEEILKNHLLRILILELFPLLSIDSGNRIFILKMMAS